MWKGLLQLFLVHARILTIILDQGKWEGCPCWGLDSSEEDVEPFDLGFFTAQQVYFASIAACPNCSPVSAPVMPTGATSTWCACEDEILYPIWIHGICMLLPRNQGSSSPRSDGHTIHGDWYRRLYSFEVSWTIAKSPIEQNNECCNTDQVMLSQWKHY